jgi:outer membrane cobalamin receptor
MNARAVVTVARTMSYLAVLAAVAAGGCRPAPRAQGAVTPVASREITIGEADIARMGVATAWDVVRMRVPRLSFAPGGSGQATGVRIQTQRSVNADETPLLVVDGMHVADLRYLNDLPASEVHAIHILDSDVAEPLYGLAAAGGAIVVETKRGR